MPVQEHKIVLPDGSRARVLIVETGLFFRKRIITEFDLSLCVEKYANLALRQLSEIVLKKIGKRKIEFIHIHLP